MFSTPVRLPASVIARPEKPIRESSALEKTAHYLYASLPKNLVHALAIKSRFLPSIHKHAKVLASLSDNEIQQRIASLRMEFTRNGIQAKNAAQCFALVREVAGRTLGMYHFDVQLLGGLALLHGNIAEMQTGEGKTLTATLPAATAALAGIPVHVITVNDYLAQRDCEIMQALYENLGLSVACIKPDMSAQEKQKVYACDVVYCTNKDLVFDYLKDSLTLAERQTELQRHSLVLKNASTNEEANCVMQRGLHFAIVDEADSVLMDEARTPLIISGETETNQEEIQLLYEAAQIAQQLQEQSHYSLLPNKRLAKLNAKGEEYVLALVKNSSNVYWRGRMRRVELIEKALAAWFLYKRDKDYIVVEDKIHIVDEHTGRSMPDRSWQQGLHQLIEIKENCTITRARSTLAKISYQRFFRLYHHLSGMTGTAAEVQKEFWRVYQLHVVNIAPHKRSLRKPLGYKAFATEKEKWQAVIDSTLAMAKKGRAVLIGTTSVEKSEQIAQQLCHLKVEHTLLNARQDQEEAAIIAKAGYPGSITIATSMAGRGTDIALTQETREKGGLHVIITELQDASRIDRQLIGRCARQGDPGSYEYLFSLEDSLMQTVRWFPKLLRSFLKKSLLDNQTRPSKTRPSKTLPKKALVNRLRQYGAWRLLKSQQKKLEAHHTSIRYQLLKTDEVERSMLGFAGNLK